MEELENNFKELIKNLIILSLPVKEQLDIMGYGCIGDEMAIDFGTYYSDRINEYIRNNIIDKEQKKYIDKIEDFFNERGGKDEYMGFWLDNEELSTNSDWDKIRDMAKECLKVLKKDHLALKASIENKSNNNDGLTVQVIQIELIDK